MKIFVVFCTHVFDTQNGSATFVSLYVGKFHWTSFSRRCDGMEWNERQMWCIIDIDMGQTKQN